MADVAEIEALEAEREELVERLEAIDLVLKAMREGGGTVQLVDLILNQHSRRRPRGGRGPGVGEDRLDAVRAYVKKMGRVRQADIANELGYNSGTVSTALDALEAEGEIVKRGKENRSRVIEVAKRK